MTTLPALTEKAQKAFNAYIRKRDEGRPCISCGKPGNQAGHYFSVKQFNALRFDEDNVHLQCAGCNKYLHGNQAMYRIGLVNRLGAERVAKLEAKALKHRLWKWSPTELQDIIKKYK